MSGTALLFKRKRGRCYCSSCRRSRTKRRAGKLFFVFTASILAVAVMDTALHGDWFNSLFCLVLLGGQPLLYKAARQ